MITEAQLEEYRDLLRELEWDFHRCCPWCHAHKDDGHVAGKCQIAAVLKQMDGSK